MTQDQNGHVELVTLHVRILRLLHVNPRMAQEQMARRLDVTMRTVQRHIYDLESSGYITLNRESKPYTYSIAKSLAVPHVEHLKVSDLLPPKVAAK